ncbi:MAG: aspartate--tRNA ligase [Spirochaetales bacterium]|jgi:aspartyl-tRNA synthetase|nr:aspartate--tRNA ligase [Spirochaetales bacterium]
MHRYRTHTCGALRKADVGTKSAISGWIHNRRDHGGVLFLDIRDHYGITQVVIRPESGFQYEVGHLHKESVVRFEGTVIDRDGENINPNMPTGDIELEASGYERLSACDSLPVSVFPEEDAPEETRLKYRYIDLRRTKLHETIILRAKIIQSIRKRMIDLDFNEFQTPILTSSSPEGARDYLVPSRVHPGSFYALPQAPQQFKQLVMMAGFDKYFQIAPCFRDEDARADRSPGEFYQLDIEMSFVTQEDVFKVVEEVMSGTFQEFSKWEIESTPFPRITYADAMLKYGTDKPDLRNPIEIRDVTEIFKDTEFRAFTSAVKKGAVVRAIPVSKISDRPRSFFDRLVEYSQSIGSKGLAYLVWNAGEIKGPIAKFLTEDQLSQIADQNAAQDGDVVFFVCDREKNAARIAGDVRTKLGQDLNLLEKEVYRFCWIVDFPMFEKESETGKIEFSHNPFSMPQGEIEALESMDPLDVLAYQYDIVCNGTELSSGAIRNHKPEIMYKAFEIAGYDKSVVDNKFPALINAFHYGAPPHGGIAPGVDRMIMLILDEPNLREVIAFPMNQRAQDLMMNAPNEVTDKQLEELSIRIIPPIDS